MELLERIEKKILRKTGKAIHDLGMIEEGDRILVALSGGKDSWTLLHILDILKKRAPVKFTVTAATVNPGFKEFATQEMEEYCKEKGLDYFVEKAPLEEIIDKHLAPGTAYCSFCARLRRGVLYTTAIREGYTKIALGHHADDLIETLLLGQFFTGEIKSMPPVLMADDGRNVVIRPLCRVFEEEIIKYAPLKGFPVVACGCPPERAGKEDQKRQQMKALLSDLEAGHPTIKANILASLGRVRTRYLMPDCVEE